MAKGQGGCEFLIEGVCKEGVRKSEVKVDGKGTGEFKFTINLDYLGGSQYLTLAHADVQRSLVRPGAWLKVSAPVRSFKESKYPGPAVILEVEGKPVGLPGVG